MRATVSHLFRFTGLTTPSHDKLSLASLARCFHGNSWRAGCCEWVSRDVTNALPTAGVGNDSKNAHTPKESGWEGERGRKRQKEVQRRLEDQCDRNWLWVENPALQFSMQLHFNNAYGGHHEERSQAPS